MLNKIVLGTANFSKKYGLRKKKISISSIKKINNILRKKKINSFDTAQKYLVNSKVLRKFINKNSEIIFKIPKLKQNNEKTNDEIISYIHKFMMSIKKNYIETVIFHEPKDFFFKNKSKQIMKTITFLKKKKIINNFGISIYNPNELRKIIKNIKPDIFQVPVNLFDRRFLDKKVLKIVRKLKIVLHARSIFLQGILLEKRILKYKFSPTINFFFNSYIKKIKKMNLSNLDASLNFIKCNHSNFKKIIIGIDNDMQLNEIIKKIVEKKNLIFPTHIINKDINFLEPRRWKM